MKVKEESGKVGLKLNIQKTKIMASGPITSWEIDGDTVETVSDFIFLASKITADGDYSHEMKRRLLLGRKVMTNLDNILKVETLLCQQRSVCQGYGFFSGHVWMWELDYKESWALKNWCFWIVVLEKTLESPLDCKEIQPVHHKGDQSWMFIGRTDTEAETPILWPPHVKSWLIGKDPDARRDWGQEEKGMTEDEMVGWHHRLDMGLNKLRELVIDREASHAAIPGVAKSLTGLSDWTELYWIYMFQCYSLKSSHSGLLPHSPKVCCLHLCFFCCLAYRIVVTIFLKSIYMHWYTVVVFLLLTYFTMYNKLQFHPPH